MISNKSKKIKIGLICSYNNGTEILKFISKQKSNITFVCSYKNNDLINANKLKDICKNNDIKFFDNIDSNSVKFKNIIIKEKPEILILGWWPQIIKQNIINLVKNGIVNLHPSYLPYGRGKHGYVWSIIDGFKYGVTIHFIDKYIDSGKILFQKRINVSILDTGESLYKKGCKEVLKLFKLKFHKIILSRYQPKFSKNVDNKNLKYKKDIKKIENINLNKKYKALDLINVIRAKNFKNDSAIFKYKNQKYSIKIQINEK